MCTLSWFPTEHGYEVFFNRDENRSRIKADPPKYDELTESIFPLDSQGGGTWVAVNRHRLTLSLLNNYQEENVQKASSSRGLIIPGLIKERDEGAVCEKLETGNYNDYQPFILCIFSPGLSEAGGVIPVYLWDGHRMQPRKSSQIVISSAVSLREVTKSRQEVLGELLQHSTANRKLYLDYHKSHDPEKGKLSVCMHRQDARTQSLSHITVGEQVNFSYHDGPPCQNNNWINVSMD